MATMTILHFADTASCGMIGFAHSIRGEVELVKDLVQMNDQGSPIILFRGGYKSYTHTASRRTCRTYLPSDDPDRYHHHDPVKWQKICLYVTTVEISRDTYFNVKLNDLERTK